MTIDDLAQNAVQLLWDNSDQNYPYSLGATGILAACRGGFYVITARHNLKDRSPSDLRIAHELNGKNFLPIEFAIQPVTDGNEEDSDFKDIFLLKVKRALVAPEFLVGPQWLDLHEENQIPIALNARLIVAGYPTILREIDYEKAAIRARPLVAHGVHRGMAESKFCHIIEFDELGVLPEDESSEPLSGLSGAPVFEIISQDDRSVVRLAGMMIRATRASRLGRFVHFAVLFRALRLIESGSHQNAQTER